MPAMTSIADFTRRPGEIISELHETQQPLYLTRNGKSSVVVMDAEAFERAMSFREQARERETRVYDGIMRGIEDFQRGNVTDAKEGLARIRAEKGW
ncbi:type II toxin-antitoxin system Phd/YefM family antitoxin [Olsenella uli]|uniref:type II toxin-antitoxin system Phd/YefM family antitoxin n=1 Tax=Olsenella uli TaxID=133926 RepID=UPI0012ABF929|nr:type II toxin-antitoxin system Phd/YefM family antitoxin [Olsenella uli]